MATGVVANRYGRCMASGPTAIDDLFATASLGSPDKAVGFVLWRVVHRYQREVDRALAPVTLTHLQFTTLAMTAWLAKAGRSPTQPELAEASGIHPMQISLMLKALEAKRLVHRTRNPADVRSKLVTPTGQGIDILRQALPLAISVQRAMFGRAETALLSMLLAIESDA